MLRGDTCHDFRIENVFQSIASFHTCLFLFYFRAGPGAQRGNEMARAAALLPPDLRSVVDRLGSLRELPAGVWKMHAGDVAHGEDADLDDSGWQPSSRASKAPE